jgi:hypothetical protein
VRDWELACYGGWGTHHWSPKHGASPNGGGGGTPMPGAGGGESGSRVNTFPSLSGAAILPLIPIDLLAALEAELGLDPDPRDPVIE